jgi:exopolysaccharide production protein ExoZ
MLIIAVYILEETEGRSDILQLGYSIAFLFAIAAMVAIEREGMLPSLPLLALLGDASYTLYLSHESVAGAQLKIMARIVGLNYLDPRATYFVVLLGVIAFSIAFYVLVERPMTRGLRRLLKRRKNEPRAEDLQGTPERANDHKGMA